MAIIKCVNCGEKYSDTLSTCPHCDYTPTVFMCPECEGILGADDKQCSSCGFNLKDGLKIPLPTNSLDTMLERVRLALENADSESKLRVVSHDLSVLGTQVNVESETEKCETILSELVESKRKNAIYDKAYSAVQNHGTVSELRDSVRELSSISGYRDSAEVLFNAQNMLSMDLVAEATRRMSSSNSKKEWEDTKLMFLEASDINGIDVETQVAECDCHIQKIKEKRKRRYIIVLSVILLTVTVVVVTLASIYYFIPRHHYNKGESLFESERYDEAKQEFLDAGDYKDATDKATLSEMAYHYQQGEIAFDDGDYDNAVKQFSLARDYKDSPAQKKQARLAKHYSVGEEAFDNKDYQTAIDEFAEAEDYRDALERVTASTYFKADQIAENGDFLEAAGIFKTISEYEDSTDRIFTCAKQLLEDKQYVEAAEAFSYSSSTKNLQYQKYSLGMNYFTKGDYVSAITAFHDASGIEDADNMYTQATYLQGKALFDKKDYDNAKKYFTSVADYSDAKTMISACDFCHAEDEYIKGYLNTAQDIYKTLPADFEYNGVSVNDRLTTLTKYSKFVEMCGKWKATGDCEAEVKQVSKSYGSWDGWTSTYTDPYDYLTITCIINEDGTVSMSGKAEFVKQTDYSSISAYLKPQETSVSINLTQSSPPSNSKLSDKVRLTYSNGKFTLKYSYSDSSEDVYFRYDYDSTWTYGKCVEKY